MILLRLGRPDVLARSFRAETLERARTYGEREIEAVEITELSAHQVEAKAQVWGTARQPYLVHLEASGADDVVDVDTWCTCPVTYQCKHGAALALDLGNTFVASNARAQEPPEPAWRTRLDGLLTGLDQWDARDADAAPLALRLTHDVPPPHAYGYGGRREPTVRLRPMRRGKRGWVKTGIDWPDVQVALAQRAYDRRQLLALSALNHALGAGFWHHNVDRSLHDFGPHLLRLLHEARAAGVELYVEPPLTGLRLLDEPARASADLTSGPEGVRVSLGLVVDGRRRPASELMVFGVPAHTVAAVDDDVLTLAALEEPLPRHLVEGLDDDEPLVVPEAEADALPDYLRRLRRVVAVSSSDESVDLPEPLAPRLRVTVTWQSAAAARVAWVWAYGEGDVARTCGLDAADRLGGLRDLAAERAVLERLPHLDTSERDIGGADTVGFALLELPTWRESEDVEVVEVDPPDFRPAEETPVISFELVEPPADEPQTDWLDLDVVIRVDDEAIPLPQVLEALTLEHEFLVTASGLYVSTDLPEFQKLADAVRAAAEIRERRAAEREERLRLNTADLGLLAALADVGAVDARLAHWVERARALRDLTDLPQPEPEGVVTTLRPYQRDGFHWLAFLWQHGLGGVLADDMGLGKTLQVLSLVAHTRAQGHRTPFLVVAPTSVVSAWVSEAARHTPGLRVRTVTRTRQPVAEVAADADVVVTTYTVLRLDQHAFAGVSWGGLVLDEAQQVKNHKSKAYEAVARLRAPFSLAVSGTPFENRLRELWSLLSIVAPGLYPRLSLFTKNVATPVEKDGDQAALRRFQQRIRPFLLRRTKELVAKDLPPKQEQVLAVELHPKHRGLYESHLAKEQQRILGLLESFDENRVAVLAALTKLRQLALDPALVDPDHDRVGSAKLDLLLDHLAEVTAEGHRALVFSSFTGFLGRVRDRLDDAGIPHAYLDGGTTDRGDVISSFRDGDVPVFLISLKAGGVGLTLTEADYVYVLDPWWNPAAEAQAVDRAHRIGQTRTVMVYRLVSADTIEDKVMALKARKAALFAQVVDGGTTTGGDITAADIRALFE